MKKTMSILAIAGFVAGCSSAPVTEQPRAEQPRAAAEPSRPTQAAPKIEPTITTQPVEKQRIVVDPLNDPNSPLSKRSIYYDFDKSEIKNDFKPLIQAHAGYLTNHRATKVRIEGNGDERGSREYNLALGQRRADNVKAALKLLGVTEVQIETMSWGEEKPRATGHDESAWAENRRSDIFYKKTR